LIFVSRPVEAKFKLKNWQRDAKRGKDGTAN